MSFGAMERPPLRLVSRQLRAEDCAMREPIPFLRREPMPFFLREAAVTLVPALTDDQLERIAVESLDSPFAPYLLVSRISDHTALIQGIPVKAGSAHEADALTWQSIFTHVGAALRGPWDWDTHVTAMRRPEPSGALASLMRRLPRY